MLFSLEIIDGAGVNLHIAQTKPTAKPLDLRDSLLSGELSVEPVKLRDFEGRQKAKNSEISQIQVWRKYIPIRTSRGSRGVWKIEIENIGKTDFEFTVHKGKSLDHSNVRIVHINLQYLKDQ